MTVPRPTRHSLTQIQAVKASNERISGVMAYHVYQLLRAAVQEGEGHLGLRQMSEAFQHQLASQAHLIAEQAIEFRVSAGEVRINGHVLTGESAQYARTDWIAHHLIQAGVLVLRIDTDTTAEEIRHLSDRFARAIAHRQAIELLDDLPHLHIKRVAHHELFEGALAKLVQLDRYPLLQLYAEGIARTMAWSQAQRAGQPIDRVEAKRLIGQVVDALHADADGMLGLLMLRPLAGTFANRRFDTAILATGIGLTMGLNDVDVRDLGVSALLRPLPDKYGPWWRRQPLDVSAAAVVASAAFEPMDTVISFESCLPLGILVPEEYYGEAVYRHISTTILNVAEGFVDLLQPDESTAPFSPEVAIQMMVGGSGRTFDGEVIRGLVRLLGLFPPGTPVQLNSGDLAVVTNAPRGEALHRPVVRPLDAQDRTVFDLSRPELSAYSIAGVVPAVACPVNPTYVFLL